MVLARALVLTAVVVAATAWHSVAYAQTLPAAPTNLQVSVVQDALAINLSWDDNDDKEDSYLVERSTAGPNGPWEQIATLPSDSSFYGDSGLEDQVTYWYRVAAVNADGGASYSNVAFGTATALPMPPTVPLPMSPSAVPTVAPPDTGDGPSGPSAPAWVAIALTAASIIAGAGLARAIKETVAS